MERALTGTTRALPAPLLRESLRRAGRVRLAVGGASMRPFIHAGDIVELLPPGLAPPPPGAVVLVEGEGGRLLLHRVTRSAGPAFHTRGDANRTAEGPFTPDRVVALLGGVVHGRRVVPLDRGLRALLARSWSLAGAGPALLRAGGGLRRAAGRLLRRARLRPGRGPRR